MFGSARQGASAYAKMDLEGGVLGASPEKLISLLYEGAIKAIGQAIKFLADGDMEKKGKAISKAVSIIDTGLRASLNHEAGGELSQRLDSLYEYMSRQLVQAHIANDEDSMNHISSLLADLKQTWDEMSASNRSTGAGTTTEAA